MSRVPHLLSGRDQMYSDASSFHFPHFTPERSKLREKTRAAPLHTSGIALAIVACVHGRRSHPRFSTSNSHGVFSVLREVAVRRSSNGELVAADGEPRQVGEVLTLETLVNGRLTSMLVRVVGSSPLVKNGSVLHELRLMPLPRMTDKETR
jgi:hypothetical protein